MDPKCDISEKQSKCVRVRFWQNLILSLNTMVLILWIPCFGGSAKNIPNAVEITTTSTIWIQHVFIFQRTNKNMINLCVQTFPKRQILTQSFFFEFRLPVFEHSLACYKHMCAFLKIICALYNGFMHDPANHCSCNIFDI